ncbi:selenium-dependent xanthine dehydrogenase [bacterium]|nr:selenium-dependent xanthine dehydrogenase [bacterium]
MSNLNFTLNGKPCQLDVDVSETLLHALRDRTGTCSVKDGCSPQGQCGCCLAMVDGRAITICSLPATKAEGKSVVTLEGIDPELRKLYGACFAEAAGLQCGFCIPGIVMRAHHLFEKSPDPQPDEIIKALDGHLCRCTGYKKIQDAIALMARARRGEWQPNGKPVSGKVGESLVRFQAEETAIGLRPYVDDVQLEGMLYGAVVLSPHPRAKVLSIDTSVAEAMPGVVRVATYRDVPGNRYYGLLFADWPGLVAEGEEVRYVGDVVAVVAAESRFKAREAAKAVQVEYQVLTPVLDPEYGMLPEAPVVNPNNPKGHNLLSRSHISRGDVEAAFAQAAHVVEGKWQTQRIEHLFLEPESCVAIPLENNTRLKMFTQGQGIFDDRRQTASFLAMKEEDIDIELMPNGGAFGGKEDMSVQSQAALLARLTGRPVKLTLSRDESVRMHPKRHPLWMEYKVGCDAEGKLLAVKARIVGDSGAYASVGGKVLERAAGHSCGPYVVPNVEVEAFAVYTNNPPCGAMRGFGVNQSAFAMEGCLDQLATRVGIDGWTIRRRNALENGQAVTTGQVLKEGVGLIETLEAVKGRYFDALKAGKKIGIACGLKNTGIGNGVEEWGKARLVVEEDLTVSIHIGYTEMGQGLLTIATQFAVQMTDLPAHVFHPKVDSKFQLGSGQTTGSRATFFVGKAVMSAAEKLGAALKSGKKLEELRGEVFAADVLVNDTTALYDKSRPPKTHSAYSFATQLCILDDEGRVTDLIAAHDVGRVVNPLLCEGQLEGSLHMGLGYALSEELPCVEGMPVSTKLRDIGVLRAQDMPNTEVILLEVPSAEGPMGAKGVGEIGLVPTAAAVASALYAFDGQTRYRLPMKESPAGKAMSVGRMRGDRNSWR